jgi:putative ABC transport system ATP-binding protein
MNALINLKGVNYSYQMNAHEIPILSDITLTLWRGETCAIYGASGSGKSSLLNILGLLDKPKSGSFHFFDRDILKENLDALAIIRNREIGFVFQSFNLLSYLTALENVTLPLIYRGIPRNIARNRAIKQLEEVGLSKKLMHLPSQLSGGQCQRVAIARALVGEPSIILADEPTGNLDSENAIGIIELLLKLNKEQSVTLIIVTHDTTIATQMNRQIEVKDGKLHEISISKQLI